jgi:hypothetical protein
MTKKQATMIFAPVLLAAALAASCRAPREDPFVSISRDFAGGKAQSLQEYAAKTLGDPNFGIKGLVFEVDQGAVNAVLAQISGTYFGSLPFRIEKNYGKAGLKDKVAVVVSTDKYKLVSALKTRGDLDGVSTARIVKGLKKIDSLATFQLMGAGFDYVEISFLAEPKNWTALAKAVQDTAPNTVSLGTGSLSKLEEELRAYRRATLWWN